MGIQVNGLRFLLLARSAGVDFTATAMIGRQTLQMSFREFRRVLVSEGRYSIEAQTVNSMFEARYAEDLLKFLGAGEVHSFDYSNYEGASHQHDFNLPIDVAHRDRYTAVLDGGSLEHVFNFPVAIRNCMQMLGVGGHYLGITPTNNYMGHGFYQFSPELYFRIFSPENGFNLKRVWLHEGPRTRKWLSVADPDLVKSRVRMMNSHRTLLLVLAEKVADREVFVVPPAQSDYVRAWNPERARSPRSSSNHPLPVSCIPDSLINVARTTRTWYVKYLVNPHRRWSRRRAFFTPFDPVGALRSGAYPTPKEQVVSKLRSVRF